jgi:hypothetical protein
MRNMGIGYNFEKMETFTIYDKEYYLNEQSNGVKNITYIDGVINAFDKADSDKNKNVSLGEIMDVYMEVEGYEPEEIIQDPLDKLYSIYIGDINNPKFRKNIV